jgi:hypothetical protein
MLDLTLLNIAIIPVKPFNFFQIRHVDLSRKPPLRFQNHFLFHRTSMNREPCSISATIAGKSGANHARNARLEQLPILNQTMSGDCRLCFARAAKSSSLVSKTARFSNV